MLMKGKSKGNNVAVNLFPGVHAESASVVVVRTGVAILNQKVLQYNFLSASHECSCLVIQYDPYDVALLSQAILFSHTARSNHNTTHLDS